MIKSEAGVVAPAGLGHLLRPLYICYSITYKYKDCKYERCPKCEGIAFFVRRRGVKTWQTNKAMVDIRRSGQLYGVGLLVWV